MKSLILLIIIIPLVEIFIMIKVGHVVGAFNTILLIAFTAFAGIYYARLEGLNTLKSGLNQLVKNDGTIVSINIDNKKEVKKVFSEVLEPHFDKWLSKHLPNYLDKYNLNKEK